MVKFTIDEFFNKYQHEEIVESIKPEVTDTFINDVCEQVVDYIKSETVHFNEDNLSTWQQEQLKKAQMEQALYVAVNGRYDRTGDSSVMNKAVSPNAYNIIKQAGFLYKGIY